MYFARAVFLTEDRLRETAGQRLSQSYIRSHPTVARRQHGNLALNTQGLISAKPHVAPTDDHLCAPWGANIYGKFACGYGDQSRGGHVVRVAISREDKMYRIGH